MTQTETATPPTPVRKNMRSSRRQPPKGTTKARATKNTLGLGANLAVSILDVSEAGIRLVLKENLPIGHEFEVTLESAVNRPLKVIAAVVWSVALANGNFCVGARLQKAISYADLSALVRL